MMATAKQNYNFEDSSFFRKPIFNFQNSSFFIEPDNKITDIFLKLDSDSESESKRYSNDTVFVSSAKKITDILNWNIAIKKYNIQNASMQLTCDRSALYSIQIDSSKVCYLEIYFNESESNYACVLTTLDENNLPTISEAKDGFCTGEEIWNFFEDNALKRKGGWI